MAKRGPLITKLMTKWRNYWIAKKKTGFTLIEMLVIITIVGVFATLGVVALQVSQTRSRDAQRKSDLEKIKVALEEYYNDKGCYPDAGAFANCGSTELSPYLRVIPCDPRTGEPYVYEPLAGATCSGYRMFGTLEDTNDPSIGKVGCAAGACGNYNYGISSGTALSGGGGSEERGGTYEGNWACDPMGVCNSYAHPQDMGCPASFANSDCDNMCDDSSYWCNS